MISFLGSVSDFASSDVPSVIFSPKYIDGPIYISVSSDYSQLAVSSNSDDFNTLSTGFQSAPAITVVTTPRAIPLTLDVFTSMIVMAINATT